MCDARVQRRSGYVDPWANSPVAIFHLYSWGIAVLAIPRLFEPLLTISALLRLSYSGLRLALSPHRGEVQQTMTDNCRELLRAWVTLVFYLGMVWLGAALFLALTGE